jgi:hypothetical protein
MPIVGSGTPHHRQHLIRRLASALLFAVALSAFGLHPGSADAATVPVTNQNDFGPGSLRQAIADAGPGDTVSVPAGTYVLTSADLTIDKDIAIQGAGSRSTIISGNDQRRVFHVQTAGTVASISSVTITAGLADTRGGGVLTENGTELTLSEALVTDNLATNNFFAGGGGIWSYGKLTVSASTFTDNRAIGSNSGAFGGGAAIWNQGTMTLTNSTLTNNVAGGGSGFGGGAGLFTSSTGPSSSTVTGSTFSQNTAVNAGSVGGNIYNQGPASTTIKNTIVDRGAAESATNCFGTIASAGHNLENADTCSFNASGDIKNTDPQLVALADHGGPTQTMALAVTSPAVDKGSAFGLATDQRGVLRPIDFPAIPNSSAPGSDGSDIGAFELQPANDISLGTLKKNKRRGTAKLSVNVPLPDAGTLALFGKGLKPKSKPVADTGVVKLAVVGKGKVRKALRRHGSRKVTIKVTYTPTGNEPVTEKRKAKLIKRIRRR